MKKWAIIAASLAALLLVALLAYRPAVRAVFYPPPVDMSNSNSGGTEGDGFDHSTLTELLKKNVAPNGYVDYGSLLRSTLKLKKYIAALADADVSTLSNAEKLALYINAYNAFTLRLITENTDLESIRDIPKAKRWQDARWSIGGSKYSLDHLEHEIIRKQFRQPLIHFALVCASQSCPPLRREAYVGSKLKAQLQQQARVFFSHSRNFHWNKRERVVEINELLDWFRGDFETSAGSLLGFVQQYIDPMIAADVRKNVDSVSIEFLDYDWRLNGGW